LLGHLVEMTKAADRGAQIQLQAIPLLSGAVACVEAGIFSSLQAANVRLRRALQNADAFVSDARYPLLFDPQTAGGLLASIPADQADDCIHALHAAGYDDSAIIGYVTEALGADNVYVTLTL
jgi:selenide, water dikinase